MKSNSKRRVATSQEVDYFLTIESSADRIRLLESWHKAEIALPDIIIRALINFRASDDEIALAFDTCIATNKPEFELWIMGEFLNWNQNIAAAALRAWARTTDRILWHRLIPVLAVPELTQRMRYTILELGPACHGFEITNATVKSSGWEELSPAFHALLLERALQFDIYAERLITLSKGILTSISKQPHPDHKAMFAAFAYLLRHLGDVADKFLSHNTHFVWIDLLKDADEIHGRRKSLFAKLERQLLKDTNNAGLSEKLPPIWSRSEAPPIVIDAILRSKSACFDDLAGFPRATLQSSIGTAPAERCWTEFLISHLPLSNSQNLYSSENQFAASYNASKYALLAESRQKACNGQLTITGDQVTSAEHFADVSFDSKQSFAHSILELLPDSSSEKSKKLNNDNIWNSLAVAFRDPSSANLATLSTLCRKQKGLAHLGFIKLAAKMAGRDDAVLKLLDYIRSDDETTLRAVVYALASINTPRSHLELIAMLTRPNASLLIQQDIASALIKKDLRDLQKELRSAIHDLKLPQNMDHPLTHIKDELSTLIIPSQSISNANTTSDELTTVRLDNLNLDQELAAMIPNYKVLSSEIKRALRTALFFNKTAAISEHADSIDLSPLIDMQYKAMELLYREFFEDMVSQSLQSGAIQRKLDVLGYARPIVRQMDDFEAYIASLPVVREIPFFSKFKLRKMLRAICQYEPGRRFTLDGLKAFGLYFLIFGRRECSAGLANTLNIGASNDREVAELCKELHVFQDFRNRAAHEGFHPDASNDIQGIWRTTALVVQWAFRIKNAQKSATPVNTKKAS